MRQKLLIATLFTALLAPAAGRAQDSPPVDCSTPRSAIATWLGHVQGADRDPQAATRCFDWSGAAGLSPDERSERAAQLAQVLDGQGIAIELEELPDTAEVKGKQRLKPLPDRLPELVLVARGGRWLVSADTVKAIPELHSSTFHVDVGGLVDELPEWTREAVGFGISWWQVLGLLLLIFHGIVLRAVVSWLVASQSARFLKRSGDRADSSVLGKAARPIGTLVMAGIIWYLLPLLQFSARVNQVLNVALRVVAAASAVMVLYRLVDVLSNVFARRAEQTETKLDDQLVPLVRKSFKVFVIALGVIFVLQNMDVDVGSLLAGASLGGLAFTLAARDTVANFFGSVSIFADRPFQVGDWVVVSGFEGIVEEVGMRSTRMRTFYNSLVTMPNSVIATSTVDNYGARRYRRCFTTLGVTYDTSPEQLHAFCDGIRAILQANEHVRQDYYEVHFSGFGAHALEIMVYFFFDVPTWSDELRERHNVFLEIVRLAAELNVSFAFPTQTIHVGSMAEPTPPPRREPPQDSALGEAIAAFGPGGARARPGGPRLTHGYFPGRGKAGSEEAAGEG